MDTLTTSFLQSADQHGEGMMSPPSGCASQTILLADDNPAMVDSTAALLEGCGYTVLKAYSARDALDYLDENSSIALVVSDIRMPDVDGFDLLRVVRHRFGSLPVVLMTGLPVTDDDVVPNGAAILQKPFTYAELKYIVGKQIAEQSARAFPAD